MTGFQWFVWAVLIAMSYASKIVGSEDGPAIYAAAALVVIALADRK